MKPATTDLTLDEINEIIAVPKASTIKLSDNRVLKIRSWEPKVTVGDLISVTVEGYIEWEKK